MDLCISVYLSIPLFIYILYEYQHLEITNNIHYPFLLFMSIATSKQLQKCRVQSILTGEGAVIRTPLM